MEKNTYGMRSYIKRFYTSLKKKGGGTVPVDEASDNQIIAVYYHLKHPKKPVSRETKDVEKQLKFQF